MPFWTGSKTRKADRPIARLGLVERVRYNEEKKALYVFKDFYSHLPKCVTCAAIASTIVSTITRDLKAEFQTEFPALSIEFV